LGGTVLAGQIYLSEQKGVGEEFLDNLRWYQLFGDPSMELRTAAPARIKTSQTLKRSGQFSVLTIKVTNDKLQPISGAQVAVSIPNTYKTSAVGKTDSQGKVELKISNSEPLTRSNITVTGYNLETHVERVKQ